MHNTIIFIRTSSGKSQTSGTSGGEKVQELLLKKSIFMLQDLLRNQTFDMATHCSNWVNGIPTVNNVCVR